MSTIAGLVRLFSKRTTRLLSSRIVSNNLVGSCRSRSVFAATMARGASQNPRLLISCACSKVCVCEAHKYTQGWYQNTVCGMFASLMGHRVRIYCSKHVRKKNDVKFYNLYSKIGQLFPGQFLALPVF